MNKDINDMIDLIVSKEFKTTMRGYSPKEVDAFLNNIIEYLEHLNKELEISKKYNDEVTKEILEIKTINQSLESKLREKNFQQVEEQEKEIETLILGKKISNLEKQIQDLKENN